MSQNNENFMLELFENVISLGVSNQRTLKLLSDYDEVIDNFKEKLTISDLAEGICEANKYSFSKDDLSDFFVKKLY